MMTITIRDETQIASEITLEDAVSKGCNAFRITNQQIFYLIPIGSFWADIEKIAEKNDRNMFALEIDGDRILLVSISKSTDVFPVDATITFTLPEGGE